MSGRVRIGTCSNPADAVLVRSMFGARGVNVVVGAEHHASLLGPLGGSFLSLDIWVAEEDAEEAAALLRDLREGDASTKGALEGDADGPDPDGPDPDGADGPDADGRGDSDADDSDTDDSDADDSNAVSSSIELRRRTALVVILGLSLTFGTAHMVARARLRGIALAAVELVGFLHLWAGNSLGLAIMGAAIVIDVVGALWIVRTADRSRIPAARLHRS